MSKNIVDVIINSNKNIGFIPSRRQVEFDGGYVNGWTTKSFSEYVKTRSDLMVVRDHGSINQGQCKDDGYESLKYDSKYFDIINTSMF